MFASDSREVTEYTGMLHAPAASRKSEANAVFSTSAQEKRRRGNVATTLSLSSVLNHAGETGNGNTLLQQVWRPR